MATLAYDLFSTPMGWVGVVVSAKGVRRVGFRPTPEQALEELEPDLSRAVQDEAAVRPYREKFEAYLAGQLDALDDVPLDMEGVSPFLAAAWEACRRIPLGETRSYAWLAAAAGRPGAFRAAGQAMARNRYPLIVPCHRVIGSDGGLHGYGGGLETKARLLALEREAARARREGAPTG